MPRGRGGHKEGERNGAVGRHFIDMEQCPIHESGYDTEELVELHNRLEAALAKTEAQTATQEA